MRTPAVLYAAKSTQDKKASIPKQLKDAGRKAEDEGWEVIGGPGVGIFKDEKFSAFSGNRGPGLKAAEEAAVRAAEKTGQVCMLVCQHSDRFARGAGDAPGAADSLIEIWHRTRRLNVHLRSFQNDVMLSKPVLVAVAAEQAYEESKRKSDAVKNGMLGRREKGLSMGGKKRFAYYFRDGDLVLKENMQPIVEHMYDEFLAGRSDSEIMRDMVRRGVPTSEGGKWHQATVREILVNPIHKGWIETKDGPLPGQHEPCVSEEKWQMAQDLRERRGRHAGRGKGRHPAGCHLFRGGMLRCGCGCGGPLSPKTRRPSKSRPGRSTRETYESYERIREPGACDMPAVARADIDTAVFSYFEQLGLDVEATRAQMVGARDRKLAEVRALYEQAKSEQHRAEDRVARVRRDYVDGKLSAEDWASFRDELQSDLSGAAAEVVRFEAQAEEVERWADWIDTEHDTVRKLAELRAAIAGEVSGSRDLDAVRAALTRLFDQFVLKRIEPGMRLQAELAWVGNGLVLEPVVREDAIEDGEGRLPVFRREPLADDGNSGMAQFMPSTAAAYGLEDPFDPVAAIEAQGHLMSDLLRQFGSPELALAAYNAGPAPVEACGCIPPYPETQAYVTRILALLGGAGAVAMPSFEVRLVA
jgi:DNA invertase Pin-like site-specific DNA recombinase